MSDRLPMHESGHCPGGRRSGPLGVETRSDSSKGTDLTPKQFIDRDAGLS